MLQFQNIILPPFLVVKSHCPCGYISVHQRKDLINKVDLCVLNTEAPCLQLEAALCSAFDAEWHRQATSSLSTNFYYIQADCENRFQTAARHERSKGNPSVSISDFCMNQIIPSGRGNWAKMREE